METCLSKWRVLGYLLVIVCFCALSSTSADAATKAYTFSINTAASVVHTTGGLSGWGEGDLSISGTFQAVITDGVIEFRNVNITVTPSDPFAYWIIPDYPGTATQTVNGYTFSGSKVYDNSTGGGNYSGSISNTAFSLSGSFNAPCCDFYNYQFALNGTVVSVAETTTINLIAGVAEVDDPFNLLGGKIKVGDVITGSYTYDTSTPDTNPLVQVGDYQHYASPNGVRINAGPWIFETNPNNVNFLIELVNDYYARDNYLFRSYNNIATPPLPGNAIINMLAWQLDDPTATALTSVALQPFPPVLQNWQSIFGLQVMGCVPDISGMCGFDQYFTIRAHVTSATLGCTTDSQCNDNNACTTDTCDPATGTCIHTPISCHDTNLCTEDSCDPAIGCIFRQITCPTGMYCDPATSNCVGCIGYCGACTTDSQCGSNNACVTNSCVAGYCSSIYIRCNDNNACTTDSCDPVSGCQHTPMNCDDGNSCTNDSCVSGTCIHAPLAGCDQNCAGKPNGSPCDDGNVCTVNDACSGGVCAGTPKTCDDGNVCTTDFCNSAGQCGHVTNSGACDDNNACTNDTCNPATGCIHTPINCNDNNACTTDTCNTATGCVHTPIVCNDNNPCTTDTCNPATGCVYTPLVCINEDPCTITSCGPSGCVYTRVDCNDNNACTLDTCEWTLPGVCIHTPISCNDNNACTTDTCDPAKGCIHTPISCNDNNACTTDTCDPATGACVHTPIQCPYIPCSNDSCDPITGCRYDPVDCSDGNACTADSCDPVTNTCKHVPIDCNDNNTCTIDSCTPAVGCVHTPIVCDDNNLCTNDSCDPATGCVFTPKCPACATCDPAIGICGTCCPAGSVKTVTIRGGGQKPTTVDLQIQTNFTVTNDACIVDFTASSITCTPGTIMSVNFKVGTGPHPSSATWNGVPIPMDTLFTIECPAVTGEVGKLVLDNKDGGGKDVDRITITVQ